MSKEEHIAYWITQSEDDWQAVQTLFDGRKYLQCLFFAHLVIEKLCKALWVKHHEENIPPRTHNLLFLLDATPLELEEEQRNFLLRLNRFQLEGRYPDYQRRMYQICTEDFTQNLLDQTDQFAQCLRNELP